MDQESAWQCSGCLATSTLDVGRKVAWTRRGPADMCIPCYRQRKTGILAVYLIGCTLLVIALGAFDLRYLAVLAVGPAMILVHELGHALAGWLVGSGSWPSPSVTAKLRGRIGDVELTLGLLPFTGRTSVHAVHTRGYRWRTAVVSVGGVTANVAAAAAVMMLPAPALVRGLVVVLTAMVAIGNLWPIDLAVTSAGLGPSDGSQLRDALRIEPDAVPTQVALYRLATASILARRGEHRRADAEVEAARALGLNEESIMPISAYLLLERGDYPAASEMFSRVTHLSRPPEHWAYDVNGFA